MKKRVLSILLAVIMVFSVLPTTAFANDSNYINNGTPAGNQGTNNGYITIDKTSASENESVTITVFPSTGYQLKSLTVAPTGFVDLGIIDGSGNSLYWKETNLGASNAWDSGDYYSWGATALIYSDKTGGTFTFKTENPFGGNNTTWNGSLGFANANTPFTNGVFNKTENKNVFTKYTTSADYAYSGSPDNLFTLQPQDDAAYAMNSSWRMPTTNDFIALAANCVLEWTNDYNSSSIAGYIVYKAKSDADKGKANMNGTWKEWDGTTSKFDSYTGSEPSGYSISDSHIFLPAAGYGSQTTLTNANQRGAYWTSELYFLNNTSSYETYSGNGLVFMQNMVSLQTKGDRTYGYSIRPVMRASKITPTRQSDGTYQFTMPDYAVTVTAEFETAAPVHIHDEINFTPWEAEDCLPSEEGNYVLTKDVILTAAWQPVGMTNLCLNGHVIKASGSGFSLIKLENNNAQFTLYDCQTTEHKGYLDENGLWHLGEKAQLAAGETAKSINGGVITGANSDWGGGVLVSNGTTTCFTMKGGTIAGNTASNQGGGVSVGNGTAKFIMNGGTITGNIAKDGGGVSVLNVNANFTMNGGTIAGNHATGSTGKGGGVYVDNNSASFNMNGGTITGNTADGNGGGVAFDRTNGTLTLGGTAKITGNVKGGATNNVYLTANKYITIGTGAGGNGVAVPATGFGMGVTTANEPAEETPVKISANGASTDVTYFTSDDPRFKVAYSSTDGGHLEIQYVPLYSVAFIMNGHGSQVPSQTIGEGNTASQPANPSASGWTFGGWYSDAGLTTAFNFSTPITANTTIYAKWTQNTPGPDPYYPPYNPDPTPEPTPAVTPGPVEKYTVPVESDKDVVQVSAKIENGIAAVNEITEDALEDIIRKASDDETGGEDKKDTGNKADTEGNDSITIDLSKAKQDVTGAELSKKSVENIADVVKDKSNSVDSVVIKMKKASVELDTKALEAITDAAQGETIRLVIQQTERGNLSEKQQTSLKKDGTNSTFEAYLESAGKRIHDFKGGKALVSLNFKPEKGKRVENYKVFYIDEEGKLQKMATKYENGLITFVTGHFSDYAVIYENVKDILLTKAKTTKKGYIKLSWNKIEGAERYVVYGARCGNDYGKLAEFDASAGVNSYTVKKIDGTKLVSGKTYKFYVAAYDAFGNRIKARSIHYIAGNETNKYANINAIEVSEKAIELKAGEKGELDVTYTLPVGKTHIPNNFGAAIRFRSDCPEVAKVNKNGIITAKSEGKAIIYIQDIGGKWCKVEVTVKNK